MQAQLACVLLLFLTCCGLCAGKDHTPTKLHLCFTLLSLQTTQNKHNAPYRRVSLSNLCRMMSGLRQETWSGEEQEENLHAQSQRPVTLPYSTCRCLGLEYLEENSDIPLKRKSPYILKRQAVHSTKSRRPYILKRNTLY
uniref:Neurotensin/neuromedin N n=1 Tax=Cynoglossus semilaevis TaxID=244447 RepID=A0A3P8WKS5_CYNSE